MILYSLKYSNFDTLKDIFVSTVLLSDYKLSWTVKNQQGALK